MTEKLSVKKEEEAARKKLLETPPVDVSQEKSTVVFPEIPKPQV